MNSSSTTEPSVFDLVLNIDSLTQAREAKIAELTAAHEANVAVAVATFDAEIADIRAAIDADPEKVATLRRIGMVYAPPAPVAAPVAANGDKYTLVNSVTGEVVKDAKGNPLRFARCMQTIGASMKEIVGDDLPLLAVRDDDTGVLHHTGNIGYRAPKAATA